MACAVGYGVPSARKGADFRVVFLNERAFESLKGGKQMDAVPRSAFSRSDELGQNDWAWVSSPREETAKPRIVKATEKGSPKVKALQWLLTHSFSGTAGIDIPQTKATLRALTGKGQHRRRRQMVEVTATTRLSIQTVVAQGLHPEIERQAGLARHPDDDGPRDGHYFARVTLLASSGDDGRPEFSNT